jgi:hypothetical protein
MKKLAILGTSLLMINGCSFLNATAAVPQEALYIQDVAKPQNLIISIHEQYLYNQEQYAIQQEIDRQQEQMYLQELEKLDQFKNIANAFDRTLYNLINTAGKTPYVYSGHTPRGWDCSGLTMWFYGELGIDIPHSASAQTKIGRLVDKPQVGDIIVIREAGRSRYHHSMLYVGDNKVIHSGLGRGDVTEILSLDNKYFKNVDMKIVRVF